MTRVREFGRLRGRMIPAVDVQAYEVNGWIVLDDMGEAIFCNDEVLMAPPQRRESEAA